MNQENSKPIDEAAFTEAMAEFCSKLAQAGNELYAKLRPEDGEHIEVATMLAMLADAITLFLVGVDAQLKAEGSAEPGGDPVQDKAFSAIEEFMSQFLPNLVKLGAGLMFDPDLDPEEHATMMQAFEKATSVPSDEVKH